MDEHDHCCFLLLLTIFADTIEHALCTAGTLQRSNFTPQRFAITVNIAFCIETNKSFHLI